MLALRVGGELPVYSEWFYRFTFRLTVVDRFLHTSPGVQYPVPWVWVDLWLAPYQWRVAKVMDRHGSHLAGKRSPAGFGEASCCVVSC